MGNYNEIELPVKSAALDKQHYDIAEQIAADTWRPHTTVLTDEQKTIGTVFNIGRMAPTGIAALAGNQAFEAKYAAQGLKEGWGVNGRTAAGLGAMFAAELAIDKIFFKDQNIRGGSMLGDMFVTPLIMMAAPMSMKYKVAASIASHIGGKMLDRYAPY